MFGNYCSRFGMVAKRCDTGEEKLSGGFHFAVAGAIARTAEMLEDEESEIR